MDINELPGSYKIPSKVEDSTREQLDAIGEEDLDIESKIDSLISIIQDADAQMLLEKITISVLAGNLLTIHSDDGDEMVLPPKLTEYLLGLISVFGSAGGSKVSIEQVAKHAKDIHDIYVFKKILEQEDGQSDEDFFKNRVELMSLQRELVTGRFILFFQYHYAAKKIYDPHEEAMLRIHGFDIRDVVKFSIFLVNYNYTRAQWAFENHVSTDLGRLDTKDHELSIRLDRADEGKESLWRAEWESFVQDCEFIESIYDDMEDVSHALWMTKQSLLNRLPENLDRAKFERYLDRMSLEVGKGSDVAINNYRYPYDFNPIHKHSIFKIGEKYIIPRFRTLQWSNVQSFYYDLLEDEKYDDFGNKFGDYLEEWTHDELMKIFPSSEVLLSPSRGDDPSKEATDVLVTHENDLYTIECKTGKLPIATREGKYEPIESAVDKKIGHAYNQISDLIADIEDNTIGEVVYNNQQVSIDNFDNYYPIVVVGEPYDALSTFLINNILEDHDFCPYVVDIYSFQLITEVLPDPQAFNKYVKERVKLYKTRKINSPHELDYLGLFLRSGFEFPSVPGDNYLGIGDHSEAIAELTGGKYGF